MIAHAAQAELRGTAFGLFHLLSGLALLAASSLAGWLWSAWSAEAAFLAAALLAAIAAAALTRYEKTP